MNNYNNQRVNLIDSSISMTEEKGENINQNGNIQNSYSNTNCIPNGKNKISKKRVKLIDKVVVIEVESWKAYNLEQTADENLDNFIKDKEKNNEKKNNNTSNNQKHQSKKENVTCTCNII